MSAVVTRVDLFPYIILAPLFLASRGCLGSSSKQQKALNCFQTVIGNAEVIMMENCNFTLRENRNSLDLSIANDSSSCSPYSCIWVAVNPTNPPVPPSPSITRTTSVVMAMNSNNISTNDKKDIIQRSRQRHQGLRLDKKNLTLHKLLLQCSVDNRAYSQYMGYMAVFIISLVPVFFVTSDLLNVWRKQKKRKIKVSGNIHQSLIKEEGSNNVQIP